MKSKDIKLKFTSLQLYDLNNEDHKAFVYSSLSKEELDAIIKEYNIVVRDNFGHRNDFYEGANVVFEIIWHYDVIKKCLATVYPLIPDDLLGEGYIPAAPIKDISCISNQDTYAITYFLEHKNLAHYAKLGNLAYMHYQEYKE